MLSLVICRVMQHSSWETTRKHYAPSNAEGLRSDWASKGKVPEKPAD